MIVLIDRWYVNGRAGIARLLAAGAAAALIAGCGSGGGGTATPPAGTPSSGSAVTPVVSSSGAGIQAQTGAGSAGSGGAAGVVSGSASGAIVSGKVSAGHSAGKLSSGKAAATFTHSSTRLTVSPGRSASGAQGSELMTPAQAQRAAARAQRAAALASKASRQRAKTSTTSSHTPTSTATTPASTPPTRTVATTKVVVLTKVETVVRNRTITRTIVKTVAPKLPVGAFMPSKHPELGITSFTVTGMNIGCVLARTGVRCGIAHRNWTAAKLLPARCDAVPESTLTLTHHGRATLSCGGANPIHAGAYVMPSGWDTTVGDYTCEVRSFAVDCFNNKSHSGFALSRTGYARY